MDKLQFLESIFSKSQKANQNYYQFYCPFCSHHKKKMGIDIDTGYVKCWVCGPKGHISNVLSKIRSDQKIISKSRELFKVKFTSNKIQSDISISLPKEYKRIDNSFFGQRAYQYLKSRGITEKDIIKYQIGYCNSGKYDGMLIFPDYNSYGQLVYFSTRSYEPFAKMKSLEPLINKGTIVFDELMINWQEPIIFVEGKIDAIILRRNAIPLYGKNINTALKVKLLEHDVKSVYLCLDGDAHNEIMINSDFFIKNGIDVYSVELPYEHDPASLGHDDCWKYIKSAKLLSEYDIFNNKIKQLLG